MSQLEAYETQFYRLQKVLEIVALGHMCDIGFTKRHHLAAGSPQPVTLLDGDKIAALGACLVRDLIQGLPQEISQAVQVGC